MEKTQPDARDSRFFGFITTLDGRRLIEAWLMLSCSGTVLVCTLQYARLEV